MKRIIVFAFFLFQFQNIIYSQNEFGAIGSYWTYSFESHDGGTNGWTMISVEKDTLINGEAYKKIKQKRHRKPFTEPAIETTSIGFIRIKNDSIYSGDDLILDFKMSLTDSLYIPNAGGGVDIQLAIDSITVEEIDGFEYKKWHGQKICIDGANGTGPYERFTILETVGQIEGDYLFWNTDNCSIGGGTHKFSCYRNEAFTYPPAIACEELLFTDTDELSNENPLEIFPNPVGNLLNIKLTDSKVEEVSILSFDGKELSNEIVYGRWIKQNVSNLKRGIYLLKIKTEDKILVSKFVKE